VCRHRVLTNSTDKERLKKVIKMKIPSRLVLLSALLMLCASSTFADSTALLKRFPAGSIQTVEQANQALDEVNRERALTQESFLDAKDECLQQFFVSSCLNKAKETQRQAKKIIRAVEVEANAFLRKDKADERDRGVAERQRQAEKAQGRKIIRLPDSSPDDQPNPVSQ